MGIGPCSIRSSYKPSITSQGCCCSPGGGNLHYSSLSPLIPPPQHFERVQLLGWLFVFLFNLYWEVLTDTRGRYFIFILSRFSLLTQPSVFLLVQPAVSPLQPGQGYGPCFPFFQARLAIMDADISLSLGLYYCSCDNLWMQARKVYRQKSFGLVPFQSMSIAGKSRQVFEHVGCYFRPEGRQMCSKVYLIFPDRLIDLIIDVTFFLQFLPFLISVRLRCICPHPSTCAGRGRIKLRTTGMRITKPQCSDYCVFTWLPSTGQKRNITNIP